MSVTITVVDSRVEEGAWYSLPRYAGVLAAATRIGEVYMTSAETMVNNVITAAGDDKIGWLNILDHGNPRSLQLGDDWITDRSVAGYEPTLRRLTPHFAAGATVHLQHCQIAQNEALMMRLAGIWGVTIKAGTGYHNPIYRFNTGSYRLCNSERCWDQPPPPRAEINWERKMCCFPAGTPVWSEQGLRPIEALSEGSKVYSFDPESGRPQLRPVVAAEVHEGRFDLRRVHLSDGRSLDVTGDHRFASATRHWLPTDALEPGSAVESLERRRGVQQIAPGHRAERVFNLRVAESACYYVGSSGLLARDY